jgi:hypothetical protein
LPFAAERGGPERLAETVRLLRLDIFRVVMESQDGQP